MCSGTAACDPPDRVKTPCRNCGGFGAERPRGLCWTCYYTPGIRKRFLSTSKFARRGVHDDYATRPLPDQATLCQPGSEGKVAVMEARAAAGEAIFHPGDYQERVPAVCGRLRSLSSARMIRRSKYNEGGQPAQRCVRLG